LLPVDPARPLYSIVACTGHILFPTHATHPHTAKELSSTYPPSATLLYSMHGCMHVEACERIQERTSHAQDCTKINISANKTSNLERLHNFSSSRHLLSKPCVENVCTYTAAPKLNNLCCSIKSCVQDLNGAVSHSISYMFPSPWTCLAHFGT
jgi:hypothetical protein